MGLELCLAAGTPPRGGGLPAIYLVFLQLEFQGRKVQLSRGVLWDEDQRQPLDSAPQHHTLAEWTEAKNLTLKNYSWTY